jgi:hypothetical protein
MAESAIEQLTLLEDSQELSIIKLSSSITGSTESPTKRASDASLAPGDYDESSPASLTADLVHYKVCGQSGILKIAASGSGEENLA